MALIPLSGQAQGTGDLTGTGVLSFALGGQAQGQGELTDTIAIALEASATGSGTLTGFGVLVVPLAGIASGSGQMGEAVPMPIFGVGQIAAFMTVDTVATPVCSAPPTPYTCSCRRTTKTGPKSFTWHQDYQGLDVTFCDHAGQPIDPWRVSYALYWVRPGGYKQLVGPPQRTPGHDTFGHYYVTGTAGECGQPGQWSVVWTWQEGPGRACQSAEECFWVLDQVLNQGACVQGPRVRKYGWGPC